MRISDWSSDVCSSDLLENRTEALADSERVRVNNDVILKLRIIDQLSGQISFGFQYRSDTPEEAEHTDTPTRATAAYAVSSGTAAYARGHAGEPSLPLPTHMRKRRGRYNEEVGRTAWRSGGYEYGCNVLLP